MVNYRKWIKTLKELYDDDGENYTIKQLKEKYPITCEEYKEEKRHEISMRKV